MSEYQSSRQVLHANGETYTHALAKGDIEETRGVVQIAAAAAAAEEK